MNKNTKLIIVLICVIILVGLIWFFVIPQFSPSNSSVLNTSGFSVIVLPDIQNYSSSGNSEILFSQVNWIVENKDNIKFVIFEGDLVNNWNNLDQWNDVNTAVSILEQANIPFELNLGNHDHQNADSNKPSPNFLKYFPESRLSNNSYWGTSFEGTNSYQKIDFNGIEYLFLGIDACPSGEEVQWANSIFSANEDKQLVLTTHGYLSIKATLKVHVCGSTEYIWNMAKTHKNLRVILAGHVHGESTLITKNDFNNDVYQLLADYQDYPNGGNGYLRILTFIPTQNKLEVKTYSPYLNNYEMDKGSSFDFNYVQ